MMLNKTYQELSIDIWDSKQLTGIWNSEKKERKIFWSRSVDYKLWNKVLSDVFCWWQMRYFDIG